MMESLPSEFPVVGVYPQVPLVGVYPQSSCGGGVSWVTLGNKH